MRSDRPLLRICLAGLCLFATCVLCGCESDGEFKKIQNENAEIVAAKEDPSFGFGEKLAVYDYAYDCYSFHGAYIPDAMRAESPEEIGAFISYNKLDTDEDGSPFALTLRFAFDESLQFSFFRMGTVWETPISIGDSSRDVPVPQVRSGENTWDMLQRWMDQTRPASVYVTMLNRAQNPPAAGGGKGCIGLDRKTGLYSLHYIPHEMAAVSDEDLGLIFAYTVNEVEAEGEYNDIGTVRGTSEQMDWELLDAVSGETVSTGKIGGDAPFVLFNVSSAAAGFQEIISPVEVNDFLRKLIAE